MKSPLEILDQAKLAERTVDVYVGGDRDLTARYHDLIDELPKAEARQPDSLAAGSPAAAIRAELDDVQRELAEATVTFRLRAMRRRAFRELLEQHPPRRVGDDIHPDDRRFGANADTIGFPLLRAALVEPQLDEARLERLLDEQLADADYERLALTAYYLNRTSVDADFFSAASHKSRTSAPE